MAANDLGIKNECVEADDEALIEGSCLIKSCTFATSDLSSFMIPGSLSFTNCSSLDGISL